MYVYKSHCKCFYIACSTQYTAQPPTALNCDPLGGFIVLVCQIHQDNGFGSVTWFWSRCDQDAGVNGTAILLEDRSDVYGVEQHFSSGNFTLSNLIFLVTNATLGYYWCEVNSSSSRPSVITPVLQSTNKSLPECTILSVGPTYNLGSECAAVGSPIVFPRLPLPSFCPSTANGTTDLNPPTPSQDTSTPTQNTPSPTQDTPTPTSDIPSETMPLALTATTTLLAVSGAFIIILVLVIVILSVCLCKKKRTIRKVCDMCAINCVRSIQLIILQTVFT